MSAIATDLLFILRFKLSLSRLFNSSWLGSCHGVGDAELPEDVGEVYEFAVRMSWAVMLGFVM